MVAAFDKLFASKVGQKLPSRVVLRANIADGPNPETHSVLVVAKSVAERETYQAELYADPAWAEFLATMSEVSGTPGSTSQGVILYNSGDLSDEDVVWINHLVTVREPAVVLNAMRTYSQSATGSKAPGQVHLSAVIAAGPGGASHIVAIGYKSEAEMAGWREQQQGDPAARVLLETIQSVSTYHGATIQREIKAWGKSVEDVATIK